MAKSATVDETQHQTPTSSIKPILFSLNTITFLLSFPIIFCVVWLLCMRQATCEHVLRLPKLQVGVVVGLIVLFVISNVVVFLKSRLLMLGLIVIMVPLVVILTIGSALIGAYKVEAGVIPGSPGWLEMVVYNDNDWNVIQSCIYNTKTCQDLARQLSVVRSYDFSRSHLSPIEAGCCIPPAVCDMNYVNATYWNNKYKAYDGSSGPYDTDCDLWQNKPTKLCYECNTCKKGFMNTLRQKWHKLGVFLVVVTTLLIVCHLLLFIISTWDSHAS